MGTNLRLKSSVFNKEEIAIRQLGRPFEFFEGVTKVVVFLGIYKPQMLREPWVKYWKLGK